MERPVNEIKHHTQDRFEDRFKCVELTKHICIHLPSKSTAQQHEKEDFNINN